ncbi:MAG: SDR family oxidoreductase [Actinobacteria bacterium]|nr:SDR family oxidoreductase [Actinomycetota bacterium]
MLELKGKVALVTGGGSGIGEACAIMLAHRGAKVAVLDQNIEAAERVTQQIKSSGGQANALRVDVSDEGQVSKAVDEVISQFGALHIAVNNAGIGGDQAPTAEQTIAGWRKVLSVNLDGVFYCMRDEIPAMIKSGGGSIINMASILGQVGYANAAGYVAAKHGVVGLTKSAALEYGTKGIRVNSVGPGFIKTPLLSAVPKEALEPIAQLHALKRLGESKEVATLVTFLASDEASFITGNYYAVDGGYLAQ